MPSGLVFFEGVARPCSSFFRWQLTNCPELGWVKSRLGRKFLGGVRGPRPKSFSLRLDAPQWRATLRCLPAGKRGADPGETAPKAAAVRQHYDPLPEAEAHTAVLSGVVGLSCAEGDGSRGSLAGHCAHGQVDPFHAGAGQGVFLVEPPRRLALRGLHALPTFTSTRPVAAG